MQLRYKCRRCERVFVSGNDLPKIQTIELLRDTIIKGQTSSRTGSYLVEGAMVIVHACSETAFGIADLQGAA